MTERTKESLRLTPRLQAIADRVPSGIRLADIGTDHGHLPLWLLKEKKIAHAIAADLRPGPLDHARENARFHGLSELVEFRLTFGLEGIAPDDCDVVSIAGMGGETIATILEAAKWTAVGKHLLLLQPMTMLPQLRQWLWKHGYTIREETVCQEGRRFYLVWSVYGGASCIERSFTDCWISDALLRAQGAEQYLAAVCAREQHILRQMEHSRCIDCVQIDTQRQIIGVIQTALEELKCQL